jgi:hypothetical protein
MWFDTFLWRAERKVACACQTVGYPALVDVQQAPRHLAFTKGDEGKGAMTSDGDGHAKREAIRHVMCSLLVEAHPFSPAN